MLPKNSPPPSPSPSPTLLLPDGFVLERTLAVHEAVTTSLCRSKQPGGTEQRVVLRTLAVSKVGSDEELALFEREAKVLKNLQHPRLGQLLEVMKHEAEGEVWLHQVRAYVEGCSLEEEAKGGKHLTEREALLSVLGIARTLAHLHEKSPALVHRDLKPQNLIRMSGASDDFDENISVIDLGAVKAGPSTGRTIVGTYGYMPPEQYEGQATPSSDVYALGMTLIYLLTHQEPGDFGDDGVRQSFRRSANISENCARLIDHMIAFEPGARPQDGAAVAVAIEALLRPNTAQQTPTFSKETRSTPKRASLRRPALVALLGLLALFGLLALAVVAWLGLTFLTVTSVPTVPPSTVPPPTVPPPTVPPPTVPPPTVPPPTVPPPTVPPPTVPPSTSIGLVDEQALFACASRLLPRLFSSEARYLSWVDPALGPTGQERVVHGLYAGYDDAADLCRAVPGLGRLASEVLGQVKAASQYYGEKDYLDDKFARGRKMHPKLMLGFARLHQASKSVDDRVRTAVLKTTAPHRGDDKSTRRLRAALAAAWSLSQVPEFEPALLKQTNFQSNFQNNFGKHYAAFAKALSALKELGAAEPSLVAFSVNRLEPHRKQMKKKLRRLQKSQQLNAKKKSKSRSKRGGGGLALQDQWDPHGLKEDVLGLFHDVAKLEAVMMELEVALGRARGPL